MESMNTQQIGTFIRVICTSGNVFVGYFWNEDPVTHLLYILCKDKGNCRDEAKFSMLVIHRGQIEEVQPEYFPQATQFWKDVELSSLSSRKEAGEKSKGVEIKNEKKMKLVKRLETFGIPFRDLGDEIIVFDGRARFFKPFKIENCETGNGILRKALSYILVSGTKNEVSGGPIRNRDVNCTGSGVNIPERSYITEKELPAFSVFAPKIDKTLQPRSKRPKGIPKKYWDQRHRLFSRYNDGIELDEESWYSVTPESIAEHIAERCRCDIVLDLFCGCGGNAIQFAFTCERVIAVDLDSTKLEYAKHNAQLYGVADRIEWIHADVIDVLSNETFKGFVDVVFLSPPWGGPSYSEEAIYDLDENFVTNGQRDLAFSELLRMALRTSENVAIYLPRNGSPEQCALFAAKGFEFERQFIAGRNKTCTAYYGAFLKI